MLETDYNSSICWDCYNNYPATTSLNQYRDTFYNLLSLGSNNICVASTSSILAGYSLSSGSAGSYWVNKILKCPFNCNKCTPINGNVGMIPNCNDVGLIPHQYVKDSSTPPKLVSNYYLSNLIYNVRII